MPMLQEERQKINAVLEKRGPNFWVQQHRDPVEIQSLLRVNGQTVILPDLFLYDRSKRGVELRSVLNDLLNKAKQLGPVSQTFSEGRCAHRVIY
jgi:hypothetical protein